MKIFCRDLLALAFVLCVTIIGTFFLQEIYAAKKSTFTPTNPLAFFCADNGEFSGMGELHYISKALENPTEISIPQCGNVTSGTLVSRTSGTRIPTITVTTGISALNAAMCTNAVLQKYPELDNIIYIGTSGWSQFEGGLDPNQKCNGGLPQTAQSVASGANALGSVCITYAAASYACGICSHNNSIAQASECYRPDCSSRDQSNLFGPCTYFSYDPTLQMDLLQVAQNMKFPDMPNDLQSLSAHYWASQTSNAKELFPKVPSVRQNCIEMDMQQILASGPADYLCREYTAGVLNSIRNNVPPNLMQSANNVTCVNAMEGMGFLRALYGPQPWTNPTNRNIRSAIIRGASNWDSYPLVYSSWNIPAADRPDGLPEYKWVQNFDYTSEKNHGQLTELGYQYAIYTTNSVALNYVDTF